MQVAIRQATLPLERKARIVGRLNCSMDGA
jgi:hypothetical protein